KFLQGLFRFRERQRQSFTQISAEFIHRNQGNLAQTRGAFLRLHAAKLCNLHKRMISGSQDLMRLCADRLAQQLESFCTPFVGDEIRDTLEEDQFKRISCEGWLWLAIKLGQPRN